MVSLVALYIAATFVGFSNAEYLPIDITTKNCGSKFTIAAESEFIIKATGDFIGTNCSFSFKGELKENCHGLCYDVNNGSFIADNETTLTVTSGKETQVFGNDSLAIGPWCSEEIDMTVSLAIPEDYEFHRQHPGYEFSIAIYNKCGDEKSMTFEEAIKHIEGYHHGDEFHENVYKNMVYGIIVGVCLATVFLIILGITVLYYRHHSNRKPSRSASFGVPEAGHGKQSDHHIRLKMKRRSDARRASSDARRASESSKRPTEEPKKPAHTADIQMMRF